MRTVLAILLVLPAFAALAIAEEEGKGAAAGEIRIYLVDKAGKIVDAKDVTVTLSIEPEGGAKRILKTHRVSPAGGHKAGLGHGGDVQASENYQVEMVVVKAHEEEGEGEEGEEEGGEHHEAEEGGDATPYFAAETSLTCWWCGMTGDPMLDKPGKCPKCSMDTKPVDLRFSAVVIVKIGAETFNVKGFVYPAATPPTYGEAVARIEEHVKTIQGLVDAGKLASVHLVAEKISAICEKLPGMAPKDGATEIASACKTMRSLFDEIDKAADAGKKPETVQALGKYRAQLEILKRHVHGDTKH